MAATNNTTQNALPTAIPANNGTISHHISLINNQSSGTMNTATSNITNNFNISFMALCFESRCKDTEKYDTCQGKSEKNFIQGERRSHRIRIRLGSELGPIQPREKIRKRQVSLDSTGSIRLGSIPRRQAIHCTIPCKHSLDNDVGRSIPDPIWIHSQFTADEVVVVRHQINPVGCSTQTRIQMGSITRRREHSFHPHFQTPFLTFQKTTLNHTHKTNFPL